MWVHRINQQKETEVDRLLREADELDMEASRMVGSSWLGDGPPWLARRQDAADKRLLAALLESTMNKLPRS